MLQKLCVCVCVCGGGGGGGVPGMLVGNFGRFTSFPLNSKKEWMMRFSVS